MYGFFRLKRAWIIGLGALIVSFIAFSLFCDLKSGQTPSLNESEINKNLKKIISRLSLEEKVGQLFHIGITGTELSKKSRKLIQKYKIGGVILFAYNLTNPKQVYKLNTQLQKESILSSGLPLFISTDQEGGKVKRLGANATMAFPSAMAFGQAAKTSYVEEAAFITAYDLRKLGINWILAPVLDINNNPKNPVINVRSFGSDVELVSKMGKAYVKGNRLALSLSAIKHFPGHGDTDIDSHLVLPRITKSIEEMNNFELIPFSKAILRTDKEAMAEVLMTAHILFPAIDSKRPATLSKKIIKKLLREKMGFQGLITTDAMEMKAIAKHYSPSKAAHLAFEAGVDIILLTKEGSSLNVMYQSLLKSFQKKKLSLKDLDIAVERQLRLKLNRALLYRWKSPHLAHSLYGKQNEERKRYWDELDRKTKKHYEKIQKKYKKRGLTLNTVVSRESITSLTKSFPGLKLDDLERVQMLVKSSAMRTQALRMGIPAKHIQSLRYPRDLNYFLEQHKSNKICIIELRKRSIPIWNKLIELENKRVNQSPVNRTERQIIALYTGNPFLDLKSPKNGAVIVSYSNTKASREALVYRVLYPNKKIKQAKLLLAKEK